MGCASRIAVLLPVLAALCACTTPPAAPEAAPTPEAPRTASATGTYYSVDDCGEYTTLRPDGTFRVWQDEEAMEGRYVLRDETILLTPDDATMSLLGNLSGYELTDNKGRTWIRPPLSYSDRDVDMRGYVERMQSVRAGWLVRPWEGRLYITRRPTGPPPPFLEADAVLTVLRKGARDEMADARNMIADTPHHTIHLALAPGKQLWPNAGEDILKRILEQRPNAAAPAP